MGILKETQINVTEKFQAFPYQKEALEAIKDLKYAAIFHEQGLGKTKIALDLVLYWLKEKLIDTVLIISKKGLVENWKREFKFHTFIQPRILTQDKQDNYFIFNSPTRVILSHFEIFNTETERLILFCKVRRIGIIIDESAKIKNPSSKLTMNFLKLAPFFERRVIMTGTPIANRPFDIWAQINFLDQGETFGKEFDKFKNEYDIKPFSEEETVKREQFEIKIQEIHHQISRFTVRETKNSGVLELPNKVYIDHIAEWEDAQYIIYEKYLQESKNEFISKGSLVTDDANYVLKKLLRLIEVTSNPRIVDPTYQGTPGKLVVLQNLVDSIVMDSEKCIIWTSFNENVEWLEKYFKYHKAKKIYGKLDMNQRNRNILSFLEDPDVKVLIATPGAAKEGLTLTVANHVIFYDRGFSLDDYLQAQDRIHRISQKKICYVHNLFMRDSIDQWINLLIQAKNDIAKLGQGDITIDEFREKIDYSFGNVLRRILNCEVDDV